MIIANSALRASLAIIISYPTRARGIIVKYVTSCLNYDSRNNGRLLTSPATSGVAPIILFSASTSALGPPISDVPVSAIA